MAYVKTDTEFTGDELMLVCWECDQTRVQSWKVDLSAFHDAYRFDLHNSQICALCGKPTGYYSYFPKALYKRMRGEQISLFRKPISGT